MSEDDTEEFWDGYRDGRDLSSPDPSENRSHRYRHSFAVGRAEVEGGNIAPAWQSRINAKLAAQKDADR